MVRRTCHGLCLVLAAMWAAAATGAPALRVEPGPQVLEGEPVHLSVVDTPPGAELTVTAERWVAAPSTQRPGHRLMRSEAMFVADHEGRVDLRTARPLREATQTPIRVASSGR
jgi:Acyl-CoA thioester hydrolase/BAAT N-terminal region